MRITLNIDATYPLSIVYSNLPLSSADPFTQFAIPQFYQEEIRNLIQTEKQAIEQRQKRVAEIRAELTPQLDQLKSDFILKHPELLL